MNNKEVVKKDKAEISDFLEEVIIKDNEVEMKVGDIAGVELGKGDFGRRRNVLEKTKEKWIDIITDAAYESCILLSMALITFMNVSACVVVNQRTGKVYVMGSEMAFNFAVQVCCFVLAWKCRNFCFNVSCVSLMVMWLFTMTRTGAWPWVNDNIETRVVIIGRLDMY